MVLQKFNNLFLNIYKMKELVILLVIVILIYLFQQQNQSKDYDIDIPQDDAKYGSSNPQNGKTPCLACSGSDKLTSKYAKTQLKKASFIPTGSSEKAYNYPMKSYQYQNSPRNTSRGAVPYESTIGRVDKDFGPENYNQSQMGIGELDPLSPPSLVIQGPNGKESRVTKEYDFRNLQSTPYEAFFPTAGQLGFSPGTLPTFGLWRPFDDVPVRECGRVSMPARWTLPCDLPGLSTYTKY
jgi:hypothetical protein